MNNDIHKVQATILKELLLNNGTNFATLNKLKLENYHFTFHLKKLVTGGIVEKIGRKYFLTQKGKGVASKLDIDNLKFEKQGGPSVVVTAKRVVNGKTCFLVHQRFKEPFFKCYGFVNGKIRFGEPTAEAAKRELLEETGLTGTPTSFGVYHKLTGPSKDVIKLDNFFFTYIVYNPKGELKDTQEGKNFWKTKKEINKLKLIPGIKNATDKILNEEYITYFEEFVKLKDI